MRVTVDEDLEDFLNVLSSCLFIVDISGRAQHSVKLDLLKVTLHKPGESLTDLDILRSDDWVLRDVGRLLLFLLDVLLIGASSAHVLLCVNVRHTFCNAAFSFN